MADLPQGRVRHLTRGRLRVKIDEKHRDEAFFRMVEERLSAWDSIERVVVNALTASVLVFFSDLPALYAENALRNDLFTLAFDEFAADSDAAPLLTERAVRGFTEANAAIRRLTGGAADLRTAFFVMVFAGGVYQLLCGNIGAPATTLFWYAGRMLRLWELTPTPPGPPGIADADAEEAGADG